MLLSKPVWYASLAAAMFAAMVAPAHADITFSCPFDHDDDDVAACYAPAGYAPMTYAAPVMTYAAPVQYAPMMQSCAVQQQPQNLSLTDLIELLKRRDTSTTGGGDSGGLDRANAALGRIETGLGEIRSLLEKRGTRTDSMGKLLEQQQSQANALDRRINDLAKAVAENTELIGENTKLIQTSTEYVYKNAEAIQQAQVVIRALQIKNGVPAGTKVTLRSGTKVYVTEAGENRLNSTPKELQGDTPAREIGDVKIGTKRYTWYWVDDESVLGTHYGYVEKPASTNAASGESASALPPAPAPAAHDGAAHDAADHDAGGEDADGYDADGDGAAAHGADGVGGEGQAEEEDQEAPPEE